MYHVYVTCVLKKFIKLQNGKNHENNMISYDTYEYQYISKNIHVIEKLQNTKQRRIYSKWNFCNNLSQLETCLSIFSFNKNIFIRYDCTICKKNIQKIVNYPTNNNTMAAFMERTIVLFYRSILLCLMSDKDRMM